MIRGYGLILQLLLFLLVSVSWTWADTNQQPIGMVARILHPDTATVIGDIKFLGLPLELRPPRRTVRLLVTRALGEHLPNQMTEFNERLVHPGVFAFDGTEHDVLAFLSRNKDGSLWYSSHVSLPGTEHVAIVSFVRDLVESRNVKSPKAKCEQLRRVLMTGLDSPSPTVAREALHGVVLGPGVSPDEFIPYLQRDDIEKTLNVLDAGDPVKEFEFLLRLGRLRKLDISQRLRQYLDTVDAVDGAPSKVRLDRDLDPSLPDRDQVTSQRRIDLVHRIMGVGRELRGRVNTDALYESVHANPERQPWGVAVLAGMKDPRAESLLVQRLKKGHTEHGEARLLGLFQSKTAYKALAELYSNPPKVESPGKLREAVIGGLLRVRSAESDAFLAKTGAVRAKSAVDIHRTYGDVDEDVAKERRAEEVARSP